MTTNNRSHNLIIIGSGPAGLTAAIYAARANLEPLLFDGNKPGGQLMGTSYVENWPGVKSILGPELMMHMRDQAATLGTTFVGETIQRVSLQERPFTLTSTSGNTVYAHAIIIATGASPNLLGCPGEQEYWGKGVTTCAVCDAAFYKDKRVIVVGGGDSAMENASFLRKFTDKITIVHILDRLTASPAMQERVINDPAITIIYESTVSEIRGNGNQIQEVSIINKRDNSTSVLPTDGLFISIGLKPNTTPFKDQITLDKHGYIMVKEHTQTSIPGVFAAGDVQDFRYRQAITSAGSGCMAALDAYEYLKNNGLI